MSVYSFLTASLRFSRSLLWDFVTRCHPTPVDHPENKRIATRRVVLVGRPNVGKSVLFNALTGRYMMVSNYPGTTVDVARGLGEIRGELTEFVDSPGIHSLSVQSDEEKATRSLLFNRPDALIQVADSKDLARTLPLTLELAQMKIPMVLCLNMKDEALSRGLSIDSQRLSKILGIPVVETVAVTREGFEDLKRAILKAAPCSLTDNYPPEVGRALRHLESMLPVDARALSHLLLQDNVSPVDLPMGVRLSEEIERQLKETRKGFVRQISVILAESRQEQANRLIAEVLTRPRAAAEGALSGLLDLLGQWSLRPWPGYLIAALILWAIYAFVGVFGAQTLVDFLEKGVFGHYINPVLTQGASAIPWEFMRNMLVGPYGVFTMALTYAFAIILPIVSTFFFSLGILEDTGYLPRLSVLLDRFFKMMGLNGKAVFPMILGLGCGTMAMLTARILDTRKEKILVSFLLALAVPCSAQLGVILAMTSGLSPVVLGIWLSVMVGTLLGVGGLASRFLPGAAAPLLIEIPPVRIPQIKNILRKVGARLKWYLREVVPLFVYGTLALFFLDALGWLKVIEHFSVPLVTGLLGLPEKATEAFLVGFFRRDYGAAGLYHLQRQGLLNVRQSAVAIVTITLFMPCIAMWLVSVRERGIRVTLAVSTFVFAYALSVAGILNRALLAFGL